MSERSAVASEEPEERRRRAEKASWLRLGVEPPTVASLLEVGALALILVALIRLMAVAHGDASLAVAILSATGYVSLMASIVVNAIPFAAFTVIFMFLVYKFVINDESWLTTIRQFRRRRGGRARRAARTAARRSRAEPSPDEFLRAGIMLALSSLLAIFLISLMALYLPWPIFAVTVFSTLLYWQSFAYLLRRRRRRIAQRPRLAEFYRDISGSIQAVWLSFAVVLMVIYLISITLTSSMWTSVEEITTRDAKHYGVVLNSNPQWTTILVYNPRKLAYVKTSAIVRRTMCKSPNYVPTVVQLLRPGFSPGGADCLSGLKG